MAGTNGPPTRAKNDKKRYDAYRNDDRANANKFRKLVKKLRKHPRDKTAFEAYRKLVEVVSAKVKKAYPLDLEFVMLAVKEGDRQKAERAERAKARA